MPEPTDLVAALAADPMYQLSTAGQELFHTNMLYWLATQRPAESAPVWELLGIDAPVGGVDPRPPIRREWHHIDLYIDTGMPGRKLVLENKVLAVATKRQLVEYRAELLTNREFRQIERMDDVTAWRLLTLLPPTFALPEPWQLVSYADLVPALDATVARLEPPDASLVAAYARLLRGLVELAYSFDIDRDLDSPLHLDRALNDQLSEARLLSMVRKLRVSRCASLINAELAKSGPGLPEVGAALSNTEGLMDFFVPTNRGRHVGWQIQGRQVRLVMLTGKKDGRTLEGRNRAAAGRPEYFEFDLPPHLAALLTSYTGKKDWLGFGHEFVHRYQNLTPDVTWRQLVDLGVQLSLRSAEHAQRKMA